ncbi:MAG TPA: porin family protein [Flavisolibacter sp.]
MKTKLSVLLALVFFTQAAMAQFHLGVKGGVNITKVNGEAFRDEFRYGYHLGGFAELGLGGNLGIQPEVLWSQYQTRVDSSFSDVYQNSLKISNYKDVKLNYLTIPLLLNYKLGSLLSLQAGPQFGILLDQSKNLVQNGQSAFKNGDFSMVGGAQIHISKIRLQGRYFVGLNNISDISNQNKWNNQGFQLSLGLAL